MRAWLTRLHRWFGLFAAIFLFIAGLTGALIAWEHELDAWLNPDLFEARSSGPARDAIALVQALEARDPRLRVTWLPLQAEPGQTLQLFVEPRIDPATRQAHVLGFDQLMLDPVTGEVQGRRQWGAVSLAPENLVPFLYKLHYSLHLPRVGGVETGMWFMGLLALAWVLDAVIALWISFPRARHWRRSFAFRWRAGGHRRVFDLHRSGGVWLWLLVLAIALTSVGLALREELMRPLVQRVSPLTPSGLQGRGPQAEGEAVLSLHEAVAVADAERVRRGWDAPAGGVVVRPEQAAYSVGFFRPGARHGDGGLGNTWLHVDARTGRLIGEVVPGQGSAGDVFMQALFPVHSGRILGWPGRVLVSLLGVAVAALSVTGVLLWARKRRARRVAEVSRRCRPGDKGGRRRHRGQGTTGASEAPDTHVVGTMASPASIPRHPPRGVRTG